MEHRDSSCPWSRPGEAAAKGTVLRTSVGKEDPVEFDSILWRDSGAEGIVIGGSHSLCEVAKVKDRYIGCYCSYG